MPKTEEARPRGRPRTFKEGAMEVLSVKVPASLRQKLTREAEKKGISRNALILEKLNR